MAKLNNKKKEPEVLFNKDLGVTVDLDERAEINVGEDEDEHENDGVTSNNEKHMFGSKTHAEKVLAKTKFDQSLVDRHILLSVRHLKQYFSFGSKLSGLKLKAVHDVNFDIKEGECLGLVGESGCGKTTTGRSIIRLYDITSGSVYYRGYRIAAGSRWNKKEIKFTKIRLNTFILKAHHDEKIELEKFDSKLSETEFNALLAKYNARFEEVKAKKKALKSSHPGFFYEIWLNIRSFLKLKKIEFEELKEIKANNKKHKDIDEAKVKAIKEKYASMISIEKTKAAEVCKLQRAQIRQIKYDQKHGGKIKITDGEAFSHRRYALLRLDEASSSYMLQLNALSSHLKAAGADPSALKGVLDEAADKFNKNHTFLEDKKIRYIWAVEPETVIAITKALIIFGLMKQKLAKCVSSHKDASLSKDEKEALKVKIAQNGVECKKAQQLELDKKRNTKKLMSEVQMIFQDPIDSLDPRMTVEDIIQEGLRIQGYHNKEENHKKIVDVLEKVGLISDYASRYPHEFSGGQRQRIGIARALIMNPRFLICDEPISALDVSIRAQILNLLGDLKEEYGLTMLFIAHDLSVVKYFCDRIAVMYFGELVELTTSDELFKHPLHPYTKSLLSAIPKPNPLSEKQRKRIIYTPATAHDYSKEKPRLTEIIPGHFVLANSVELEKYKQEIAAIDNSAKQ
jgi:oligopeptide transport system ATP-binding protein